MIQASWPWEPALGPGPMSLPVQECLHQHMTISMLPKLLVGMSYERHWPALQPLSALQ